MWLLLTDKTTLKVMLNVVPSHLYKTPPPPPNKKGCSQCCSSLMSTIDVIKTIGLSVARAQLTGNSYNGMIRAGLKSTTKLLLMLLKDPEMPQILSRLH